MLTNTISGILLFTLLSFPLFTQAQNTSFELKTVVIDAGHGGRDPGATMGKVLEKDIVLDVSLRAGKLIKERFPQVDVIYTRNKDVFVTLAERADIANRAKADLFISVHCNSFHSAGISGAETYILGNHRTEENLRVAQKENAVILLEDDYTTRYEGFDPNSAESYIMFELIQNEFLEQSRLFADHLQRSFVNSAMRRDRGVRQAGFLVLRRTTMPSVLVELGFISNQADMSFLISEAGKNKMAQAIADAFATYKNRVDSRSGIVVARNQATEALQAENIAQPNRTSQAVVAAPASIAPNTPLSKTVIEINPAHNPGQWYAIQIMASRNQLSDKSNELKSILPVYHHFADDWHRYYLGITQNIEDAKRKQDELKKKFNGAFLVSFIDGKRDKVIRY